MLYEEKVTSFSELAKRLRVMDQDAGVRLIGGYGRKEFLVFVTRFGTKFTMMRYSMTRGSRTPGRRLETLELETFEQLKTALRKIVHGRVRAWIY